MPLFVPAPLLQDIAQVLIGKPRQYPPEGQGEEKAGAPPGAAAPSRLPVRLHAWSSRHGEDDAIACLQACEGFRRHGQHDHLAFRRSHPHAL